MPTVQRRVARAQRLADAILRAIAEELRHARIGAGLSQSEVGAAAEISRAELSRIERAVAPWTSFETVCRVSLVLGLTPSVRLYPDGPRLRDAASVRVLDTLRAELHMSLGWATEVPVGEHGDRRAWDAVITGRTWRAAVECETRLFDLQALERRIALKRRDDGGIHVLLLVPRSSNNRAALEAAGARLRGAFPLDSRTILAALRAGQDPGNSGIVTL